METNILLKRIVKIEILKLKACKSSAYFQPVIATHDLHQQNRNTKYLIDCEQRRGSHILIIMVRQKLHKRNSTRNIIQSNAKTNSSIKVIQLYLSYWAKHGLTRYWSIIPSDPKRWHQYQTLKKLKEDHPLKIKSHSSEMDIIKVPSVNDLDTSFARLTPIVRQRSDYTTSP